MNGLKQVGNVSAVPGTLQVAPGGVPRAPLAGTTAPQQWQITNGEARCP